jgi:hypothetical protein
MKLEFISGIDTVEAGPQLNYGFTDIAAFNRAEMHLIQTKRRLEIIKEYYGSNPLINKNILTLENAITNKDYNLRGIASDKQTEKIFQNIAFAGRLVSQNDTELVKRDQKFQTFGFKTLTTDLPPINDQVWINSFLVKTGYATGDYFQTASNGTNWGEKNLVVARLEDFDKNLLTTKATKIRRLLDFASGRFREFETFRKALATKYEPTGHHLLYEFIQNPSVEPSIVQTKNLNHKQAIEIISQIAYLDRQTVSLWTENGIMVSNTKQKISPYEGKETIEILRSGSVPKIGEPVTVTVAVIAAITAAIGAVTQLVATIKGTPEGEFISNAQGYGTNANSPSPDDFRINGGGGNPSDIGKYLPYALGAGALYFLTQKK